MVFPAFGQWMPSTNIQGMKNGTIGVTTENIFPVIKKFLYSDHEIFLREIVANAVDATQKMRTLAGSGVFQGELGELKVRVSVDKEARTLTVSDSGIGMSAEEIDRYINQIAFSSAEEFMAKYKDQAIIGHFGLGFYSSFMVSDKVEIPLYFHRRLLEGSLPQSIGGGIGQSRLCMILLHKAHVGETQSSIWPAAMRKACRDAGMTLI